MKPETVTVGCLPPEAPLPGRGNKPLCTSPRSLERDSTRPGSCGPSRPISPGGAAAPSSQGRALIGGGGGRGGKERGGIVSTYNEVFNMNESKIGVKESTMNTVVQMEGVEPL